MKVFIMNIEFKKEKLESIITKLDSQIQNLTNEYDELKNTLKQIDGSNDIWKGKTQKIFYDYYEKIAKEFPGTIKDFTDYRDFLKMVVINYSDSENSINSDIDKNKNNLGMD